MTIDVGAMLCDYQAGMRISAIAAKYGCSPTYPTKCARAAGLPLRRPDAVRERMAVRRKAGGISHADLLTRYDQGARLKDIASDFGVAPSYVRRVARKAGRPARNAREAAE